MGLALRLAFTVLTSLAWTYGFMVLVYQVPLTSPVTSLNMLITSLVTSFASQNVPRFGHVPSHVPWRYYIFDHVPRMQPKPGACPRRSRCGGSRPSLDWTECVGVGVGVLACSDLN